MIVLSRKQADEIIAGKREISLDLGISLSKIKAERGFVFAGNEKFPLAEAKAMKDNFVYFVEDNKLKKVELFYDVTNRYYKLTPTLDWPTFMISSVPMHRFIHLSPKEDTVSKIKEIHPVKGIILDTCCGLGYTAIMSSKTADEVHTFERDKAVLTIAKINPYSRELFESKKIKIHTESVFEGIKQFKNSFFDRIIHDPPTFKISPELYSKRFYEELFRVMKKEGTIYHYAPMPGKTKGSEFYHKIIRLLKETGFKNIEYHLKSSGIRAVK
jgi:predicted methyltransferase